MEKILYVMRHGQTQFNVRRKIQGGCDSPLTLLGIRQAMGAAQYFKQIELDHLYCSTSERCSDTLELIVPGREYTRLKGLKEMNFGIYEGESEDLNPDRETFEAFFVAYGGESRNMVRKRMVETCTQLMNQEDHHTVLAVSHAGSCLHFMRAWCDPSEELKKGFSNCCICKYAYKDGHFTLLEVIRPNPIDEKEAYKK